MVSEILSNLETLYTRIKEKHQVFAESKEEKEVHVGNKRNLLQDQTRLAWVRGSRR